MCVFPISPSISFSFQLCNSYLGSGMKRNWLSLSKAFLRDLQRPVYALVSVVVPLRFSIFPSVIGSTKPRLVSPRRTDDLRINGHRCSPLPPIKFTLERFSSWSFHVSTSITIHSPRMNMKYSRYTGVAKSPWPSPFPMNSPLMPSST